jgi:hypothetical protein
LMLCILKNELSSCRCVSMRDSFATSIFSCRCNSFFRTLHA